MSFVFGTYSNIMKLIRQLSNQKLNKDSKYFLGYLSVV